VADRLRVVGDARNGGPVGPGRRGPGGGGP
jgi:hypothetical protein